MSTQDCVAMLLAGGQGSRLKKLTETLAKPAVPFGGKYRIIDFCLSNCLNSDILTVGVLTQYQPLVLNSYIGIGSAWDLDRKKGGVTVLPPFLNKNGGGWYEGTANAIYQNLDYLRMHEPSHVLVLSGDHVYKMDYAKMLRFHREQQADVTISVFEVPWEECSRFGIMNTDDDFRVNEFEEKPSEPRSNLASMGVYMFDTQVLYKYLEMDQQDPDSSHDFGKDVIPLLLREGLRIFAYPFKGYWKDVGTVESLWQANMDLLEDEPSLNLFDREWRIYSVNPNQPPQYIAPMAHVKGSLINEGCLVYGHVEHSILFPGVKVGQGSKIIDSVIMNDVEIENDVIIEKSIIDSGTVIEKESRIGPSTDRPNDIVLIGQNLHVHRDDMFEDSDLPEEKGRV